MRQPERWMAVSLLVLAWCPGKVHGDDATQLAAEIRESDRITLATSHVSGVTDDANTRQNIKDAAAGKRARRSHYEKAPGGEVALDPRMLKGMLALAKDHTFRVSEIAGGSHSANSRHYAGVAFDIDRLDGQPVDEKAPGVRAFMERCRSLGATEVLGPGDPGHATHIHAAWPRP